MTDTAAKRASALNVGPTLVLPQPDGSIDAADRAQLAKSYAMDQAGAVSGTLVSSLFVQSPLAERYYLFDWSSSVAPGLSITGVEFTVPMPVDKFADLPDLTNDQYVIGVRAVPHAMLAMITAVATRSDSQKFTQILVIRGFNG